MEMDLRRDAGGQRRSRGVSRGTKKSYEMSAKSSWLLLRGFMAAVIRVRIIRTQRWSVKIQEICDDNCGSSLQQSAIWAVRELCAFRMCVTLFGDSVNKALKR